MKPKPLTKNEIYFTDFLRESGGFPVVEIKEVLAAVEWLKRRWNNPCLGYNEKVKAIDEAFEGVMKK